MCRKAEKRLELPRFATLCCIALLLLQTHARANTPVSVELVLAVDTSLSVDDHEYELQMTGIAKAFRTPEIMALIEQHQGVAVTLFQWSTQVDERYVIPWHVLKSPQSVLNFAAKVESARRDPVRGFTAIGKALEFGLHLILQNRYVGKRMKIDLSGDGRNNTGVLPDGPRLLARAHNVTINGLPVLIDTYGLEKYFRKHVIAGPDAFVEIATDYRDFADAFFRKLRRELTTIISDKTAPSDLALRRARLNAPIRQLQLVPVTSP